MPVQTYTRVKHLREALAKFPDDQMIMVVFESKDGLQFFGVDDVAIHKGTSGRDDKGKMTFCFDGKGPAECLFISVSEE